MCIVQALIHDAVVTESTVMDQRHLNNYLITDMTFHLFLIWSGVLVAVQDILDELCDKGLCIEAYNYTCNIKLPELDWVV